MDLSTSPLPPPWLRDHRRRGMERETVRARIPGSPPCNSLSWKWLHHHSGAMVASMAMLTWKGELFMESPPLDKEQKQLIIVGMRS